MLHERAPVAASFFVADRPAPGKQKRYTPRPGRNAVLQSRNLFSGFMRCAVCGTAVIAVNTGGGSPRYGCRRSWRNGVSACRNRLTIRAKIADASLLDGLREELLRPPHLPMSLTPSLRR
jgi:site-specific DNA recombinase